MKRILVPLLAATLTFGAACVSDATSPGVSIMGNWTLRTLNGQSLPVQTAVNTTVTDERRTLHSDGSYDDIVYYSDGNSSSEFGYYTISGNSITFTDQTDNNFQYTGSISGNVLTTFDGNFTSVYQKS